MPGRSTTDGWLWRAGVLVLAWVGLTGALIAVGIGVEHSSVVNGFDRHVTSVVVTHRTPALDAVMRAVTWLGSWVALVVTGSVVVVLTIRRRLPLVALVLAAVFWAGEAGAVAAAKHLVKRARPPQRLWLVTTHGWSWPSGHAAVSVVVFATAALTVTSLTRSRSGRFAAWALASIAVALVAFSRIELGVHWTTDVIASLAFVSGWLVIVAVLFSGAVRMHRADVTPRFRRGA